MEQLKAEVKVRKHVYDLDQAAFYFKQRMEDRVAKGDRDGLAYDMMACLIFLAFALEAKFNFLGHKLIADWDERKPALEKARVVLTHLKLDDSLSERPYIVLVYLKDFRDTLAHAKPCEVDIQEDVVATFEGFAQAGRAVGRLRGISGRQDHLARPAKRTRWRA